MIRGLLKLALLGGGIYAGLVALMFLMQGMLVFPGRATKGSTPRYLPPGAEELGLTTPSGIRLYGIFLPSRPDPSRSGAILFFPGNGESLSTSLGMIDAQRAHGLHVFAVDYPGYGGSGGSPSSESILEAAETAMAHLLERPEVDPGRIFVMGRSLGSGPACHLASRHEVAGLVLLAPFTELAAVASHHFPWLPVRPLLRHRFDNVAAIRSVKAPLFIAHSIGDEVVPSFMSEELAQAARQAGISVTLVLEDFGGHNDASSMDPHGRVGREMSRFLEHTGGD